MKGALYLKPRLGRRQRAGLVGWLLLVLLLALLGFAWWVVKARWEALLELPHGRPPVLMAMAPLPPPMVTLLVVAATVATVICLALGLRARARQADKSVRAPLDAPLDEMDALEAEWRAAEEQLQWPEAGVPRVERGDGARIAGAAAAQCGWIRLHLTAALVGDETRLVAAVTEAEKLQRTLLNLSLGLHTDRPNGYPAVGGAWLEPRGGSGS